jgi:hypothetical protein
MSDGKFDIPGLVHEVSKAMVIAATESLNFHAPMNPSASATATASLPGQGESCGSGDSGNSAVVVG